MEGADELFLGFNVARERELEVRLLDLRNSGDTAAERARVVGYGAFALYETRVGR
jgi:MEMO1 family protein